MPCIKDGTEKCAEPTQNDRCGWCFLIGCPQAEGVE